MSNLSKVCCVDNSFYRLIQTGIYYESMTLDRNAMIHLLAEFPHIELQKSMWNSQCQVRKIPGLINFIR
jgi:hypothetical protein